MTDKKRNETMFTALKSAIPSTGSTIAGKDVVANTNVVAGSAVLGVRKVTLTLKDFVVDLAAADDFGGTKLCDLPNSNLLILGAVCNLAVTVGGGITNADDIDVALGTKLSTGHTTQDLDDGNEIIDEYSAVTAAPTGTANAHSFDNSSPALVFLDAGASNMIALNVEATISAVATATFTGTIDVFYLDLDEVA